MRNDNARRHGSPRHVSAVMSDFVESLEPEPTHDGFGLTPKGPAVATVAVETLADARFFCDPSKHPDQREYAERVCSDLDCLIDQAEGRGWPL